MVNNTPEHRSSRALPFGGGASVRDVSSQPPWCCFCACLRCASLLRTFRFGVCGHLYGPTGRAPALKRGSATYQRRQVKDCWMDAEGWMIMVTRRCYRTRHRHRNIIIPCRYPCNIVMAYVPAMRSNALSLRTGLAQTVSGFSGGGLLVRLMNDDAQRQHVYDDDDALVRFLPNK